MFDNELSGALVVLAPSQMRAVLAGSATVELADDTAKRLLERLAHTVWKVQKAPDLLSGRQLERFGHSIESVALHAVDHAQPVLLRASGSLLAGLGDIAGLARVFRYAESQGYSIDPDSFAEPFDAVGVTSLAPGWEQTAFWQAHLDHRASSEELLLLGAWYLSLRPLLARRLIIRGVTWTATIQTFARWNSADEVGREPATRSDASERDVALYRRVLGLPVQD